MKPTADVAAILERLVSIPSVSSLSNQPIIAFIESFVADLGWDGRVFSYRDGAGVQKLNLVTGPKLPTEGQIDVELAVVCHTDTVPYSPEWDGATQVRERDGMLHGCGACDVKGFLSCMLAAAPQLDTARIQKPFCFVFTADEEVGCRGARFLYDSGMLRARYAIVGEPTSLVPSRAGKGYCLARVTVHGKAAHSAYPGAGASAIMAAVRLLADIDALSTELMSDRDESFTPPHTTINVGEIHGGTAKNVVPAECSFLVEWRPIPTQNPRLVCERLEAIAGQVQAELGADIRIDIETLRLDAGFATPEDSRAIAALRRSQETPVQTIAFGTEAPWMARMGAEAVVIGPGSMLTAHSPRECVPVTELHACTQMLCSAIEQICG